MSALAIRPTFTLTTDLPPEAAVARLAQVIAADGRAVVKQRVGRHMMVTVPETDRHFWSPWMTLEASAEGDDDAAADAGPTRVFGRFSPAPSLWTGFMFSYIAVGALACFAATWAAAQATMKHAPSALWVTAACVAIAAALWWASRVGQRLAQAQMAELRALVEAALGSDTRA